MLGEGDERIRAFQGAIAAEEERAANPRHAGARPADGTVTRDTV